MSKKMKNMRGVLIPQYKNVSWEASEWVSDVEEDERCEKSDDTPVSGYLIGGI